MKPAARARVVRATPTIQFNSRGLRNAPVKKTRNMCTATAATKMSADQWCICRMSRPPRMSKLMFSVDAYASDM